MTADGLSRYLHDHIPLSAAMAADITALSAENVAVTAPLAPNINHRDTAFGGSVSAAAILAAWALVHHRLTSDPATPPHKLVIAENSIA